MEKMEKIRVMVYLKPKNKEKFTQTAKKKNMSLTAFIEEATSQYLKAEEMVEKYQQMTLLDIAEDLKKKKEKIKELQED